MLVDDSEAEEERRSDNTGTGMPQQASLTSCVVPRVLSWRQLVPLRLPWHLIQHSSLSQPLWRQPSLTASFCCFAQRTKNVADLGSDSKHAAAEVAPCVPEQQPLAAVARKAVT